MSTEPTKVPILAEAGDKNNILTNTGAGFFEVATGFGLRLAQDLFPKREDFNGLANLFSKPLNWLCKGGTFAWSNAIAADTGYPIRAIVKKADNSGYWSNMVDNNTTDPDAAGAGWESVTTDSSAALTALGGRIAAIEAIELVTEVDAQTGTATAIKWWSALRVRQAIVAYVTGGLVVGVDHIKLPTWAGGWVFQVGQVDDVPSNTAFDVVFTIPFPTVCFHVSVNAYGGDASAAEQNPHYTKSPTGFTCMYSRVVTSSFTWFAIGK